MTDRRASLRENLAAVRSALDGAAARSGRDPVDVTLVAICKEQPAELVSILAELGVDDFGENYAQELAAKRGAAPAARWHFVGRLQSHTAHRVAEHADLVHSAVPGRALQRLDARATSKSATIPVLLQVDESGRHQGVAPSDAEAAVRAIAELEGVDAIGLMTLPPAPHEPEDSRPYFARLRELRDDLAGPFPELRELSMGMSLDCEIAVEEGATMVRVGTALFGPRPSSAGPLAPNGGPSD